MPAIFRRRQVLHSSRRSPLKRLQWASPRLVAASCPLAQPALEQYVSSLGQDDPIENSRCPDLSSLAAATLVRASRSLQLENARAPLTSTLHTATSSKQGRAALASRTHPQGHPVRLVLINGCWEKCNFISMQGGETSITCKGNTLRVPFHDLQRFKANKVGTRCLHRFLISMRLSSAHCMKTAKGYKVRSPC